MSDLGFLDKLLDGAETEWKPLEEIINSLKTGLNPRKNFHLNTSDAEGYYVTVREIQGGKLSFLEQTDRVNQEALKLINNRSNLEAGDILFSGVGTVGRVVLIKASPENWNIKEGVYAIKPNKEKVRPAYLAYLLSSQGIVVEYQKKVVGSPVVSLPMKELRKLFFPIPCPDDPEKSLAIQGEIVRILDSFTELTTELTAELKARKKQYNHYRDQLLTFEDEDVRWTKFLDIAEFRRGTAITKKETTEGDVPVVANGPVPSYSHGENNREGETVVVARSGAYAGYVSYWNQPIFLTDAFSVHPHPDAMTPKFVYHVLQNKQAQLHAMKKGAGVPHVRVKEMEQYDVPVPSLETQHRIVEMLDKFDTLTTSLSEGLPLEIELRQKQFQYYRDLLLSFPKPAEAAEA